MIYACSNFLLMTWEYPCKILRMYFGLRTPFPPPIKSFSLRSNMSEGWYILAVSCCMHLYWRSTMMCRRCWMRNDAVQRLWSSIWPSPLLRSPPLLFALAAKKDVCKKGGQVIIITFIGSCSYSSEERSFSNNLPISGGKKEGKNSKQKSPNRCFEGYCFR